MSLAILSPNVAKPASSGLFYYPDIQSGLVHVFEHEQQHVNPHMSTARAFVDCVSLNATGLPAPVPSKWWLGHLHHFRRYISDEADRAWYGDDDGGAPADDSHDPFVGDAALYAKL